MRGCVFAGAKLFTFGKGRSWKKSVFKSEIMSIHQKKLTLNNEKTFQIRFHAQFTKNNFKTNAKIFLIGVLNIKQEAVSLFNSP